MVNLTIDGRPAQVPEGTTILEAARQADIHIPHLCYLKGINEIAACRVCCVEVEGERAMVTACNNPVQEGMAVHTNSPRARSTRRINVELILSQHDCKCATCVRSGNCQLQEIANDLGILELPFEIQLPQGLRKAWTTTFPLFHDYNKCIKCMRCIQVCDKIQSLSIWDVAGTGSRTTIDVSNNRVIKDSDCALCGQCITHCPTGGLRERDDTQRAFAALADPDKITVVQVAPAVRTAWGEAFGLPREQATMGRMAAALRRLGFRYIFDTNFTADLTIMEEGSEFFRRLQRGDMAQYPMFTSCCPGWVRFLKGQYPQLTGQLSTAKSPQQMFGSLTKSWLAQKLGVEPEKIFCVSIMPCVAKKYECDVPELSTVVGATHGNGTSDAGLAPDAPAAPELAAEATPDVDAVLTVREFGRLLRMVGVDCAALDEVPFDNPLGLSTGAATIFGRTGGVMEAALRSAAYLITGENPDFSACDTTAATPETPWMSRELAIGDATVRIAVASGLENTSKLLDALESGEAAFDFVEIMACPGGCVGGGGQPIRFNSELAQTRAGVLNRLDAADKLRYSHENPDIAKLYADWIGEPLSHTAHEWLHTDQESWKI